MQVKITFIKWVIEMIKINLYMLNYSNDSSIKSVIILARLFVFQVDKRNNSF